MRLQKYLALCGVASRRKAEELISEGKVRVDGEVVQQFGTLVNDSNLVEVKGVVVRPESQKIYIMLNKPSGYVTTSNDQFGRAMVLDLIKGVSERVYPVGRLDYETEGLLLLTNDGELANLLTHPKHNIQKTYSAEFQGNYSDEVKNVFEKGIEIDGKKTRPAKLISLGEKDDWTVCNIVVSEGRNRQIRRLFEAAGRKVRKLRRIAMGKLLLGDLKLGKWRALRQDEIEYLKSL